MSRPEALRRLLASALLALLAPLAAAKEFSAQDFFRPQWTAELLSPAGTRLATLVPGEKSQRVLVTELDGNVQREVFDSARLRVEEKEVVDLQWISDEAILVETAENRRGVADLVDTRRIRRSFVVMLPRALASGPIELRQVRTPGGVVSAHADKPGSILYGRSGGVSRVYRIDVARLPAADAPLGKTTLIDGGQFTTDNEVASMEGFVLRWLTDANGTVRAATTLDREGALTLWYRAGAGSAWETLRSLKPDEAKDGDDDRIEQEVHTVLPLALSGQERGFYLVGKTEQGDDALFSYDYASDKRQLIYSNPDGEIFQLQFDSTGNQLLAAMYLEEGELHYHYLDAHASEVQAKLEKSFAMPVRITGIARDGRRHSVLVGGADQPGALYLYDAKDGSSRLVHAVAPWLEGLETARIEPGTVQSHELAIGYLLTLPPHVAKPPLLVLPHGGPIGVSDSRLFSAEVQYLASRGLAVLQVNYRGSGGKGKAFLEAGKKQFGARMLDDIEAAIEQVVATGKVDADARCVVGGSYGGYAALMLAIRRPDAYRCVASIAGLTDIALFFDRSNFADDKDVSTYMEEYIGDPQRDYEYMKSISPVYRAAELRTPLFLAHGDEDLRVDIDHAWRMRTALDAAGIKYRWKELKGQGHGFDSPEAAASYYAELADFVLEHIAGAR